MARARGFTLIELLIVVAIIGIIAAIAVPALLRARVSANEAAAVGDIRTVLSSEVAYQSTNGGYYDALTCLVSPSGGCVPGYPTDAPTFLDSVVGLVVAKQGYQRYFAPGAAPAPMPTTVSPSSILTYVYGGTPLSGNQTGVRGFAGDHSGRICQTPDGTDPAGGAATLPVTCLPI